MSQRSSADVTILVTGIAGRVSDGGVLAAETGVLSLNGISREDLTEEGWAIGDDYVFFAPVGISRVGEITMQMFFDDTATTGNYERFALGSRYRTLQVKYGGTTPNILTQTMDIVINRVNIVINRGEKLKLEIGFQPASDLVNSRT